MAEKLANLSKEGLEFYSTDEVVVGTYLGKPRYRKTIQTTVSQMVSDASYLKHVDISSLNIDKPLYIEGIGLNYSANPPRWDNLVQIIMGDSSISVPYSTNVSFVVGRIYLSFGSTMQTRITGAVEFTIEYTKTTD